MSEGGQGEERLEELREENELLRQRLSEYQTIFDATPIMFWFKDTKNRLLRLNRAAAALEGVEPAKLIGRRCEDLYPPEQAAAYYADDLEVIRANRPRLGIVEPHTKPGSDEVRWLSVGKVPVHGPDGEVNGVIAFAVDITEERRLQGELQQRQKLELVGRLAGGVAHDFNNVLCAIMGSAEVALRQRDPDDVEAQLHGILDGCQRAAGLTRQLLAYARQEPLRFEACDVREAVRGALALAAPSLQTSVQVAQRDEAERAVVLGDLSALQSAVLNLLLNARDAMPEGGELRVELSDVAHPGCEDLPAGRYLQVAVSDTGQGIDDAHLPHLFDPFFTTKEVGKGTGLGLAAVQGTARAHGGLVRVGPGPAGGACFRLLLPTQPGLELPAPQPAPAAPDRGRGTLLLVDDEPVLREVGQRLLSTAGYEVIVAEDGAEALAVCEQVEGAVDLAILDLAMPRLSGPATLRLLRERYPEIRGLFVSGYDLLQSPSDQDRALLESCELLAKPYRAAELRRAVARALSL